MSGQFLCKVHSDGTGALKKGAQSIGKSRGGWTTKIHLVAAGSDCPLIFRLSPGNAHDGPEGCKLIELLRDLPSGCKLLMDKAYCGAATRRLAEECGLKPVVVPPKSNAKNPWSYDTELYKRRNEVERLFCRIKRFRRIATRYDKLDIIFLGFLLFAFVVDLLLLR